MSKLLITKKPVTVEAFQITTETLNNYVGWPKWMQDAFTRHPGEVGSINHSRDANTGRRALTIHTRGGEEQVRVGDVIIRGVESPYRISPDTLSQLYVHENGDTIEFVIPRDEKGVKIPGAVPILANDMIVPEGAVSDNELTDSPGAEEEE